MTVTLKRSLHIDSEDIPLLTESQKTALLKHKFIIRAANADEGVAEIESVFSWMAESCENHYRVRGPEHDSDTIKYYVYFEDESEATQFKLSFPQN